VAGSLLGGASSEASPSARRLAALADTVRRLGAPALFLEAGADARLAEQVAADSGVRVVTGLHTESLTGPAGPAPDYLAMMRHDARLIASALAAPEEDE
jgi:zinc/manganese transport system substrate-binding protein